MFQTNFRIFSENVHQKFHNEAIHGYYLPPCSAMPVAIRSFLDILTRQIFPTLSILARRRGCDLNHSRLVLSCRRGTHPRPTEVLVIKVSREEEREGRRGRVKSRELHGARERVLLLISGFIGARYVSRFQIARLAWRLKRLPLDWMPGTTEVVKKV